MNDILNINLNDEVRFKLTEEGKERVKRLNKFHVVYREVPLVLKPDDDGYCKMQLWDFANVFGPAFGNGSPTPIETSIQIRRKVL